MELKEIIDTEIGKIGFVCGLSRSLSAYEDFVKKKENSVIISCNEVDRFTSINPNYWVFSNSVLTMKHMINRILLKPNSVIVNADSVDPTPWEWIEKNIPQNRYVSYDQRHVDSKSCNPPCKTCLKIIKGRKTIQEELSGYCKADFKYGSGDTVALHMLSLAILLGCKEIYLFGIDIDYRMEYVNGSKPKNYKSFENELPRIVRDFLLIKQSAELVGAKIFNTSKDSKLREVFEYKNPQDI